MTSYKKLLSYTASHVGLVRSKNDDSSYAGSYFTVIADGMGGHAGGDIASALTVLESAHLDRRYPGPQESLENILIDNLHNANSLLGELATENPALAGMGTTASAVLLIGDKLQFAHIGDSRIYRLGAKGCFEQISTDHTYVQQLVDDGRLSRAEASVHPNKNVVTRILGDVDASAEIDSAVYEAVTGDRWLLCSDGLTDVVSVDAIAAHMQSQGNLKDIVEALIGLTLEAGSPDNVTIALFDIVPADSRIPHYSQTLLVPDLISDTLASYPAGVLPEAALQDFSTKAIRAGYDPYSALTTFYLQSQLQKRPHILAGAASLAMEYANVPTTPSFLSYLQAEQSRSGEYAFPVPFKEDSGLRRPSESTQNSDSAPESEDLDGNNVEKSRKPEHKSFFSRRFYTILTVLVLLIISTTAFIAYSWIKAQYYVGIDNNKVAIFRGIPQRLGPISFSSLEKTTDTPLEELDDYSKNRVHKTIISSSKEDAEQIIHDLSRKKNPQPPRPHYIKPSTPPTSR